MKVMTSELSGAALDWAVAGLEGEDVWRESRNIYVRDDDGNSVSHYSPSTYWAQCGPIIEREKIDVMWCGDRWCAYTADAECTTGGDRQLVTEGNTALIAAMRGYVTSKLGDEIKLPKELNHENK